jgi:hypothetical protein
MTNDTQREGEEPRAPADFAEDNPARNSLLPGKVVGVIVGLAMLWILILAYFVAKMPAK